MADIFLSYSHTDRPAAERLAEALQKAGYSVWWDNRLAGGTAFLPEIEKELLSARCVVVIWSVRSVKSEWVLDEADTGKRAGKLVPVRVDLAPAPLGFRQLHEINLEDWVGSNDPLPADLASSIKRLVHRRGNVDEVEAAGAAPARAAKNAIAVLPLGNGSGDPRDQYFVDGMHEAIIIELAKQKGLDVISRVSTNAYRDTVKSAREIGAELDVGMLIEGRVLKSADEAEISLNLIDTAKDRTIWADSYTSEIKDLLGVHRKIAQAIVEGARFHLAPPDAHKIAGRDQVNPVAYDHYLKGMYHWYRLSPDDLRLAEESFENALAADPTCVSAHSGIATMWTGLQQMNAVSPLVSRPKIKHAIAMARSSDASAFQAVLADACYQTWSQFDWNAAERSFKLALELNPSFPDTYAFYSHFLNIVGRFAEAKPMIEKARRLDPFNPLIGSLYCVNLQFWGQFDTSISELNTIKAATPDLWLVYESLRISHRAIGEIPELVEATRKMFELLGDAQVAETLARYNPGEDHTPLFCEAANKLSARNDGSYVSSMAVAELYDVGEDTASAVGFIEKGFEIGEPSLPYIKHLPRFCERTMAHPKVRSILRDLQYP